MCYSNTIFLLDSFSSCCCLLLLLVEHFTSSHTIEPPQEHASILSALHRQIRTHALAVDHSEYHTNSNYEVSKQHSSCYNIATTIIITAAIVLLLKSTTTTHSCYDLLYIVCICIVYRIIPFWPVLAAIVRVTCFTPNVSMYWSWGHLLFGAAGRSVTLAFISPYCCVNIFHMMVTWTTTPFQGSFC